MKRSSWVILATFLVSLGAQAQAPTPTPEQQAARDAVRKNCASDMEKLCSGKKGREAMSCLRANSDQTSQDCKDALAKLPQGRPPGASGNAPPQQ
jgi:hypothetical protein